jgi:hypothetical protein
VQTPIEALGRSAENEGEQDPAGAATDKDGERRRQVRERQRESRPDEGPEERYGGSD